MFNKIKLATILLFIGLFSVNLYAQVPQGFNFQAIARGADGLPLINQELSVRISVLEGSETGTATYVETHTLTTNAAGLLQLIIGQGTPVESSFGDVNWSGFDNYVKLEIDPAGGTEFEELGTSRLLSVPYAILAENVVNGGGVGGDFPLEINLNTANTDSSLIINIDGDKTAKPLQVFSRSTGFNGAIWGEAISESSNPNNQRGTYGMANGTGTGQHVGVFGGAVNFDATGGTRRGIYGQAASKAKYNHGVAGIAAGEGNGESETDPENGDFGSFNVGGFFESYGNLNGNVGAEGVARGEFGSLRNFGLIGTARTFADGRNIGMRAEAFGSSTENTGAEAVASGETKNVGLRAEARNGTSNIAIYADADTAAILNGETIINGDLTVTGNINGSVSGGGFTDFVQINTDDPSLQDSLTIVVNGTELESESALGLNVIGFSTGRNRPVLGQIREDASNNASQYAINGRSDGLGGGSHIGVLGSAFNSDAVNGGTRYGLYGQAASQSKYNFGAFTYATGAGSGELVAIGDEVDGNFGTFNIGYGTSVFGNANGNTGIDVSISGDQGSRINIGAEFRVFTTASGQNSGVQSFVNGSSSLNRGFFGLVNGDNENVGMDLTVEGGTSNKGLIVNATTAAELNGNVFVNGTLEATTVTQTSDKRLKTNIQTLNNALDNTLKLRGVSYNWLDKNKTQANQTGVIAQEVEEIYPEFVRTDENGMKSVNYSQMTAVLIEAVKELNAKIESLEAENNILQAKIDEIDVIKAQLSQVMNLISNQDTSKNLELSTDK